VVDYIVYNSGSHDVGCFSTLQVETGVEMAILAGCILVTILYSPSTPTWCSCSKRDNSEGGNGSNSSSGNNHPEVELAVPGGRDGMPKDHTSSYNFSSEEKDSDSEKKGLLPPQSAAYGSTCHPALPS